MNRWWLLFLPIMFGVSPSLSAGNGDYYFMAPGNIRNEFHTLVEAVSAAKAMGGKWQYLELDDQGMLLNSNSGEPYWQLIIPDYLQPISTGEFLYPNHYCDNDYCSSNEELIDAFLYKNKNGPLCIEGRPEVKGDVFLVVGEINSSTMLNSS